MPAPRRASIAERTLRTDRWWLQPLITVVVLVLFIAYSSFRAFQNAYYYAPPYISPFYSPCITTRCEGGTFPEFFAGPAWISPALYILVLPLGIRLTCYYYRKAYYRAFWLSPPACAVAEPHAKYSGETRFPLIMQNLHRYFFYIAAIISLINTYDAIYALGKADGSFGLGLGNIILLVNVVFLWAYTISCHSCRHIMGGRLKHFSKHPVRYKLWGQISTLNAKHMELAWITLGTLAFTDAYIALVSAGVISDLRFIN